jgi:dienelactone hydrolase
VKLAGFVEDHFEYAGAKRVIYRRGEGPPVVIMHEIPGIIPEVRRFAERVAAAGFSVAMPHLFGTPGKPYSNSYAVGQLALACVSREIRVFAERKASPITEWLRALCRAEHQRHGGKGVGAIGMCLTGNFALALMVDEAVMAPVLSQPSLPFPVTARAKQALHVSEEQLVQIKRRCESGVKVLGLRFTHDFKCPRERFDRLRRELGEAFEAIEIDSSPGNRWGFDGESHSVVTRHLVDEAGHPTRQALDRVLSFLNERLR